MQHEECTCEICWEADGRETDGPDDPSDMVICEGCEKTYHTQCVKDCDSYNPPGEGEWPCPACRTAAYSHPEHDKVTRVEWSPTWEPESGLPTHMLQEWKRLNHGQPPRQPQNREDSHLTNLERQGTHTVRGEEQHHTTQGQPIRRTLTITHAEANPDLDIHPSDTCRVERRTVRVWRPSEPRRKEQDADLSTVWRACTVEQEAACVYNKEGQCEGALPVPVFDTLCLLYRGRVHAGTRLRRHQGWHMHWLGSSSGLASLVPQ
jgi:hypothetical protein